MVVAYNTEFSKQRANQKQIARDHHMSFVELFSQHFIGSVQDPSECINKMQFLSRTLSEDLLSILLKNYTNRAGIKTGFNLLMPPTF